MSKSSNILKIYKTNKTVFTAKDLALIWQENNLNNLKSKIRYYINKEEMIRLRKGIYAKQNYNKLELAVKIYTPSYISFETVLSLEGVIFQYYDSVFAASYLTREIECLDKQKISYRKLKNSALLNTKGIIKKENYFIASKERAFLDMVYLRPNYYFDNLNSINWKKCFELADMYENKKMISNLNSYYKNV